MWTLAWLAAPVVATLVAVAWVAWAGRPEATRAASLSSVDRHERFRQAMNRAQDTPSA